MKTIVFLVLIGWSAPMVAQSAGDSSPLVRSWGLRLHQGTVLIHSRDVRPIANSYPRGLEANLAWQKTSRKAWESCLCYPRLGIALTAWDYDNPEVLGWGLTNMFYIEPVFNAYRKLSFSVKAALGLSWQSNPHDPETNPLNLSYSTAVAFPLSLGASLHYQVAPQWSLDLTGMYNHFSNGGIREPNKGINWPTASLGVSYFVEPPAFQERPRTDWRDESAPRNRFDITFFTGIEQPGSSPYVYFPGLEFKFSRQLARLSALTAGLEYYHDRSDRYDLEEVTRNVHPHKLGLAAGHEFLLGRFIFGQQFGVYLLKPYTITSDLYQRYTLVYRWTPRFHTGVGVDTHGHVAEFVDIRVGYAWNSH